MSVSGSYEGFSFGILGSSGVVLSLVSLVAGTVSSLVPGASRRTLSSGSAPVITRISPRSGITTLPPTVSALRTSSRLSSCCAAGSVPDRTTSPSGPSSPTVSSCCSAFPGIPMSGSAASSAKAGPPASGAAVPAASGVLMHTPSIITVASSSEIPFLMIVFVFDITSPDTTEIRIFRCPGRSSVTGRELCRFPIRKHCTYS